MTARITTAGTAIAERLDTRTAYHNATTPTDPPPISTVEELAIDLLLRHHLNQPEMHYEADETAWDKSADQQSSSNRDDHPDGGADDRRDGSDDRRDGADNRGDGADDADLQDEPPF